jgi:hypothetical protein
MATLADAARLMFRSRRVYILAAGLVNLIRGLYLQLQEASWRRMIQIAGSVLLAGSLVLLISAFVWEPGRASNQTGFGVRQACMRCFSDAWRLASAIGNPRRERIGK